ncbi:MAG TPA: ATP-binding protein [Burkholderiales bacterium]|nr:ATP-binding protein [Burkholderiales bacterium]
MPKSLNSISLKWRAACVMTLLAAGALVLASLVQREFARADLRRVIADQQTALVTRVAEEIDSRFEAAVQVLQYSSASLPLDQLDSPQALYAYYRRRPELFVFFDNIAVVSPQGRPLSDYESATPPTFSVADRENFKQTLATGRAVISAPLLGRKSGEPIVQITVPVFDPAHRIVAVVVGVVRLRSKNFLADLSAAKVGRTGYFMMFTKGADPVYVVHPEKDKILQPRIKERNPAITIALGGAEAPVEEVNRFGIPVLYAFKSLQQVDWLLVAAVPASEVFAPLQAAERRLRTILAVMVALMLPLGWWLTSLTLNPLTALRDKMEMMRRGVNDLEPVLARRGDEIGALARSFDRLVVERRGSERLLSQARERLDTILNSLPVVVAYADPADHYQFVNALFVEWYGKPLEAVIGHSVREVLGDEIYAAIAPMHQAVLTGRRVQYRRETYLKGRASWIEVTLLPDFDADDRVVGFYIVIIDITDQKQAEDRQQAFSDELAARVEERTSELREANRELQTFVYSVAHNFRGPLRAINGYSALISEDTPGLPRDQRDLLSRIRGSSSQLATLIDGLLRLANLRTAPLNRDSVDLSALARHLIDDLAAAAPGRVVKSRVQPGMMVRADREMLRELMAELIGNAWKFGAARETLEIEVGTLQQEDGLAWYVRDNGSGLDPALADKLFIPFSRLHGVEEYPGHGIGLALAQRILLRHGGSIRAQGSPDTGACFIFTLGPQAA